MSEFLDYIHNTEKANAMTEEERLALHKKHKRIQEARLPEIDDDDDFYDEELETIQESRRVNRPQVRRQPVHEEPVQEPVYCVPKPTREDYIETEELMKSRTNANHVAHVKKSQQTDFNEAFRANPVLREAYNMMDDMKKKIEDMFYQYGMTGLEKLNESMLDVFEEILNPTITITEPVHEIPVQQVPVKPVIKKKVIKKKPVAVKPVTKPIPVTTPAMTETIEQPPKKIVKAEPQMTEEMKQQKQKEMFEAMCSSVKTDDLGSCLAEQSIVQTNTESATTKQMKAIAARAELLQKQSAEKTKKKQKEKEQELIENYEQPEEFDIVEDDADSTELDITKEELETEAIENEEN